ncbi:membrane protein [Paractinoplanes tereljensis]|uniref:Membrane protein n=1 Tax=Paractinoplanes tereljensis TaxID=571912 RepID=A0A919NLV7_9ACTN|nr:membrane protein [Actinoplanes tereljensis]
MRGLTTRGRSFLAAAAAAGISAIVLGERDLLRVAVLLAALPLLAAAYVGRSRYKLACTRSLEPGRAPVGSSARVILRLQNMSRLPTGTLLLEDKLPYALGSRPRVVLERLGSHQASSVAYTVRADVRGRYPIGPLVIRLTDPFGLCELTRSFPSVDRLTVIPQVIPLPTVRLAGEYAGTGDSRARSVAVHGEDDAATREYRRGDDLRRVHWRSTARTGELMVRREEQPWESRATVVLDTRVYAHRGEGPTASFEWAVSATASIAMHLRHAGYKLRLVTGSGVDIDAAEVAGEGVILDTLADAKLAQNGDISVLVEQVRRRSDGGLVIGIFGSLTVAEAELLAGLRGNGATCIGFAIDSSTWVSMTAGERQEADREHAAAALALVHSGWRSVPVTHGATLPDLWPAAARGSSGFAWRAAMAETVGGVIR